MKINSHPDYLISKAGTVYSLKNKKFLKPQLYKGYDRVTLSKDNKVKRIYVHRLVAETFIPNPVNKEQVNHLDGNKSNNHISNLEWCTRSENLLHYYKNRPGYILGEKIKYLESDEDFEKYL